MCRLYGTAEKPELGFAQAIFSLSLRSLTRLAAAAAAAAAAAVLAKYLFSPKSERIYIRSPMWHSMEY